MVAGLALLLSLARVLSSRVSAVLLRGGSLSACSANVG